MAGVVERIGPELSPGAIVTDVGSVKALLCETLPGLLPRGVRYVGSHPMAGSHLRGLEHARADLFEGAVCIVTHSPDGEALERTSEFWRALGARVVHRDPAEHDAEVAWMSHVPHVLAFAFAGALAAAPPGAAAVAGAGFRDFTRIAQSDPELWGDILTANRKALGAPLARALESLQEFARALESGDADDVERRIASARAALARISTNPGGAAAAAEPGRRGTPSGADQPGPPEAAPAAGRGRRSKQRP
jgi:prephenate dehydrogenase